MDEIKPHVTVWWRTGDQSQQIMKSREVVMSVMWSGNLRLLERVPPDERRTMPTVEESSPRMVDKDAARLEENRDRVLERWNAWLAK